MDFAGGSLVKNPSAMQETCVEKITWRRHWQPTPGFLPRKFHRQRSLVGHSPCSHKRAGHLPTKQQQQQCTFYPSDSHSPIPRNGWKQPPLLSFEIVFFILSPSSTEFSVHSCYWSIFWSWPSFTSLTHIFMKNLWHILLSNLLL